VESDGGISVIVPGARNMLVGERVADVAGEELAFGIGGQEVAILLRREVEVAIEFAAMKAQVEVRLAGRYAAEVKTLESKGNQSIRHRYYLRSLTRPRPQSSKNELVFFSGCVSGLAIARFGCSVCRSSTSKQSMRRDIISPPLKSRLSSRSPDRGSLRELATEIPKTWNRTRRIIEPCSMGAPWSSLGRQANKGALISRPRQLAWARRALASALNRHAPRI
jgi:hypothetical protein